MTCPIQERGVIELFFYGELSPAERDDVHSHLRQCASCRSALEDLSTIRAALASRPDVATPPGGDWSRFTARLEAAVAGEHALTRELRSGAEERRGARPAWLARTLPYLAAAAVLALATIAAVVLVRRHPEPPAPALSARPAPGAPAASAPAVADPALVSVSDQHFERSKLVVLGLTTKDASTAAAASWEYERDLATTLLGDTRLYRHAAEERGMRRLAGVMRDLELVLLQTSMADEPDRQSLEQLQRLIRRRDLITRMNAGYAREP
jgi:hypothetical protein